VLLFSPRSSERRQGLVGESLGSGDNFEVAMRKLHTLFCSGSPQMIARASYPRNSYRLGGEQTGVYLKRGRV
jgi:hypothetical protein